MSVGKECRHTLLSAQYVKSGDLSLIVDGFRCKQCDGTFQETDLAEDVVGPRSNKTK